MPKTWMIVTMLAVAPGDAQLGGTASSTDSTAFCPYLPSPLRPNQAARKRIVRPYAREGLARGTVSSSVDRANTKLVREPDMTLISLAVSDGFTQVNTRFWRARARPRQGRESRFPQVAIGRTTALRRIAGDRKRQECDCGEALRFCSGDRGASGIRASRRVKEQFTADQKHGIAPHAPQDRGRSRS